MLFILAGKDRRFIGIDCPVYLVKESHSTSLLSLLSHNDIYCHLIIYNNIIYLYIYVTVVTVVTGVFIPYGDIFVISIFFI